MMAIAACVLLIAMGFIAVLRIDLDDLHSPERDLTGLVQAFERQGDENQGKNSLARHVEQSLTAIPPEKGGGYILDNIVHEYPDREFEAAAEISDIRAVYSRGLGSNSWKTLEAFRDLECLNEQFFTITDDDLQCLSKLEKLEILILQADVSSSQAQAYYGRKPPYSAASLEPLRKMNHLRQLILASDRLLDDALGQIKFTPHLSVLSLHGHFTNDGLKHLGEMPCIRRLSLTGHFNDDGLAHLAKLETLETLSLSSDLLTGPGLSHLANLPNLRHLVIRGLRPGWTFEALKDLPALEVVNIGDDGLTNELLATLPYSDRIISLSLYGAHRVTDEGAKSLLHFPNLEELDLLLTGMSPQSLETISSLTELRKLLPASRLPPTSRFLAAQAIEQGLLHLSRLTKLEELDLRYMGLEGVDVRGLDTPNLRKLNVDSGRCREEIQRLREQFPELDPVTTKRITTRAEIVADTLYWSYDFLGNQLEVEID